MSVYKMFKPMVITVHTSSPVKFSDFWFIVRFIVLFTDGNCFISNACYMFRPGR